MGFVVFVLRRTQFSRGGLRFARRRTCDVCKSPRINPISLDFTIVRCVEDQMTTIYANQGFLVEKRLWRVACGVTTADPPPTRAPQDTTFNQNLSYTILSWPENHVQDLLELWRLQVLFFATIIFNILLSALLFFADNPDRCARATTERTNRFKEIGQGGVCVCV